MPLRLFICRVSLATMRYFLNIAIASTAFVCGSSLEPLEETWARNEFIETYEQILDSDRFQVSGSPVLLKQEMSQAYRVNLGKVLFDLYVAPGSPGCQSTSLIDGGTSRSGLKIYHFSVAKRGYGELNFHYATVIVSHTPEVDVEAVEWLNAQHIFRSQDFEVSFNCDISELLFSTLPANQYIVGLRSFSQEFLPPANIVDPFFVIAQSPLA